MGCEFKKCDTFWKNTESLKVTGEPAPGSDIHGLPEKVEMGRGAWSSPKYSDDPTHVLLHIYKVTGAHFSPHSREGVEGVCPGGVCVFGGVWSINGLKSFACTAL